MRSDDPAAARVQELIDGFWPIHVLAALAQLEVPEALASGPVTAGDLAQRLGLDEFQLFRLLRAGSALGVCRDLGGRRFALTSAGALLRADAEGSLRGEVLFYRDMSTGGFADIPEIVRTGRAGHSVTLGPEGFDQLAYHPDRLDAMHQTMVGSSRDVAVDLCRIYDFSAHRTVVDAGGGYGGLLAAVLQSCKHLTGSVFDLPSVERGALAYLEGQRLALPRWLRARQLLRRPAAAGRLLPAQVHHPRLGRRPRPPDPHQLPRRHGCRRRAPADRPAAARPLHRKPLATAGLPAPT